MFSSLTGLLGGLGASSIHVDLAPTGKSCFCSAPSSTTWILDFATMLGFRQRCTALLSSIFATSSRASAVACMTASIVASAVLSDREINTGRLDSIQRHESKSWMRRLHNAALYEIRVQFSWQRLPTQIKARGLPVALVYTLEKFARDTLMSPLEGR